MRPRVILFCIILSLVAWSLPLNGTDADSLFVKAKEYYDAELYNDAIAAYSGILEQGYESAGLYYNLGNAWFKTGDLPHAILYYEKARKLSPNDEDILFNLRVANTKIPDNIEQVPELFIKKWWRNLYLFFNSQTWSILGILFLFLFFFFLAIYLVSRMPGIRRAAFSLAMIILPVCILFLVLASHRYNNETSSSEAIVFSPTVTVKSSPRENSVDLFVIHEGTKVFITKELSEWFEIRIASGSIGWIPSSDVVKI